MDGDTEQIRSMPELEADLAGYREEIKQVQEFLEVDPENGEYVEMANGLQEVIELTEELLAAACQTEVSVPYSKVTAQSKPSAPTSRPAADGGGREAVGPRIAAGTFVEACYTDGEWYEAYIKAVTNHGYQVIFTGYTNAEEVPFSKVRALPAEAQAEAMKKSLKMKVAEAKHRDMVPKEVPQNLRINPDDSEEVKATKKKKVHAFKSKQRLEMLEVGQNKRQNAWQEFQTGGKKAKVGFFTGKKRESIFKSPEDVNGKVGVIGSGRGITEFQKREKYLANRTETNADE